MGSQSVYFNFDPQIINPSENEKDNIETETWNFSTQLKDMIEDIDSLKSSNKVFNEMAQNIWYITEELPDYTSLKTNTKLLVDAQFISSICETNENLEKFTTCFNNISSILDEYDNTFNCLSFPEVQSKSVTNQFFKVPRCFGDLFELSTPMHQEMVNLLSKKILDGQPETTNNPSNSKIVTVAVVNNGVDPKWMKRIMPEFQKVMNEAWNKIQTGDHHMEFVEWTEHNQCGVLPECALVLDYTYSIKSLKSGENWMAQSNLPSKRRFVAVHIHNGDKFFITSLSKKHPGYAMGVTDLYWGNWYKLRYQYNGCLIEENSRNIQSLCEWISERA